MSQAIILAGAYTMAMNSRRTDGSAYSHSPPNRSAYSPLMIAAGHDRIDPGQCSQRRVTITRSTAASANLLAYGITIARPRPRGKRLGSHSMPRLLGSGPGIPAFLFLDDSNSTC